jgi:putative oxidoreductase
MKTVMGRFSPQFFAVLRIVAGLLFACHGTSKLLGWPPGGGPGHVPIASMMGLAGIIELVGGVLITVGLLTGIVALICSGEMAAAYFMAHFPSGPIPLLNKGELSVIYCFLFLYIASHGAGIWSVDNAMSKSRR